MRIQTLSIFWILIWMACPFNSHAVFIAKRENLKYHYENPQAIIIASTGRSGSTMLTEQIAKYVPKQNVLKTHLLPPKAKFKGKIIFIFSNPDQAAESALYMTLHHQLFAKNHFNYMETADRQWIKKIGGPLKQTEQDNLLSYDAFGTYEHLKTWLYTRTEPTDPEHAQILAIKYENLWDHKTTQAIRSFLNISDFRLPPQRTRGRDKKKLYSKEINFRKMYNLGTEANPRYAAYDDARVLWEQAPSFQYLKILK